MGRLNVIYVSLTFVVSLIFLSSCEQSKPPTDSVVIARVGNEFLTLDYALDRIPTFILSADSLTALSDFREEWIQKRLLYLESKRVGLHKETSISDRLKRSEVDILAQSITEILIANSSDALEVTPSEVRDYYERNRDQFVLQERYVQLRHMVTKNLDNAIEAKADLLRGIPWEVVVDRFAAEPEETLEKSQHYFPVSALFTDNPSMRQYINVIGITEISPIRGHDGEFHFIQITDDKPRGDHPDIDWVFEQIRDWLTLEKKRRFIRSYQHNLLIQAEANNEIDRYETSP
jgi:hypothetical protein